MSLISGVDDVDFHIITGLRLTVSPSTAHALSGGPLDLLLDGLPLRLHVHRLVASASAFGWTKALAVVQAGSFEHTLGRLLLSETALHKDELATNSQRRHTFRIRILLSRDGTLQIQHSGLDVDPLKLPLYPLAFSSNPFCRQHGQGHGRDFGSCKVALAQSPIDVSLFTQHKTTHRSMYNAAATAAATTASTKHRHHLPPTAAEVLLFNPSEQITEATMSTVYFPLNSVGADTDTGATVWVTPDLESGGNASTTRAWALEQGWCTAGKIMLSEARKMHGQTIWLSNAVRGFWSASLCLVPEEWEAHLRACRDRMGVE